jgi:GH43 family beta-xylosidase
MSPSRLALLLLAFVSAIAPAADVSDFFPVVAGDGADPWVVRHDGWYYMTATTGTNVTVWRSKSLSGIGGGEAKVVWTPPGKGPASKNLWAPELHRLNGKWYVYYAADDGANENHRMFVLENASADPFDGRFEFKGKIADPKADRWAIDGTVLTVKDKSYFVWSGWVADTNVRQELYIAPMKDPWTLAGPRVEISRPTHKWETVGEPTVNEGPQALVRNGTVHLVYSASGSWTDDYCLGLLTLKKDADPLDPKAWAKHPKPVFEKTKTVFGPGHCSFTTSPDGKEDWIVYHAARHTGAGWARNVRMQPFEWNADDTPKFGTPADASTPLKLPAGDPKRIRLEPTGDAKADVLKKGGKVEFAVTVKAKGAYTMTVRHATDTAKKEPVAVGVSVNGMAGKLAECEYTAGDWSAAVLRVELKEGKNTVTLTAGKPGVTIDCVDLADAR